MSYLKGLLLVIAALLLALLCTLITIPLELSTAALALASSY
jgi:hypothetical protein